MPTEQNAKSPYQEALEFIRQNPGCGSTMGMSKLILSLWNSDCCFSYRECISQFDNSRLRLAQRIMSEFNVNGETQELCDIGHRVHELYPRLWDLGQAGTDAKDALNRRWREEREARERDES